MNNHNITTTNWANVLKIKHYDLAILPWGATEPHNYHLPYCTDMLASQAIGIEVAEKATEMGVNSMVLPGIPLGSQNPGQMELPFCIHTSQKTQFYILRDIVYSLNKQGINKLLIINGHGGNVFKGFIRDLAVEFPNFVVCCSDWFNILPTAGFFEEKEDDHAGELETSVMLHYYPHLVDISLAGDGSFNKYAIDGLNNKVAWLPRDWSKVSKDTGVGDPRKATAEKGARYMQAVIPILTDFVVDLVKKPMY